MYLATNFPEYPAGGAQQGKGGEKQPPEAPLVLSNLKAWNPMASCSQESQASMSASFPSMSDMSEDSGHLLPAPSGMYGRCQGRSKHSLCIAAIRGGRFLSGCVYPVSSPPHVQFSGQYFRFSSGGHFQSFCTMAHLQLVREATSASPAHSSQSGCSKSVQSKVFDVSRVNIPHVIPAAAPDC